MSFTVEWPLLTNKTKTTSGIPNESANFPYNAAEWDAVESVQLEIVARGSLGTVRLTPGGLGAISVASSTPQRYVSADIFPSLVSGTTYRLEIVNGSGDFTLYGARLLIRQANSATKTVIPFEIGHFYQTFSQTYVDLDPLAYYQHVASRFGGTVQFFFEAEIASSSSSGTAECALQDTANTVIAKVSTTSTSNVVLRSAAISLVDGAKYKVSLRNSVGYNTTKFHSARVLAVYTSIAKLPIPRTVFEVTGIGTVAVNTSDFIYWDPAQYPSVVVDPAVVEHMIQTDSTITVTSSLWNGTATSYSASLSGGTSETQDLVASSAAALPSSITSYQGRGVANGSSVLNRIRSWRLIVPVIIPTPVSVTRLLAGEWRSRVATGKFSGIENLVAALAMRNIAWESLVGARAARGIARENLATAAATRGIFHENIGVAAMSRNLFHENLVGAVIARGPLAEYRTTAGISQPVSGEQLAIAVVMRGFGGEVLVLVPVSRVLHGEWGQIGLVVVGGMIPVEWLLGVRTIQSEGAEYARREYVFRSLHSETLGMTLIGRPVAFENLGRVLGDGREGAEYVVLVRLLQHPAGESLIRAVVAGRTALESLGVVGRVGDHGGEFLALVRPSRPVFAEGLASATIGRVVTAEELARIFALHGLTLEDLSGVIAQRGEGSEWVTVVDSLRAAVGESLRGTGVVYIIAAEDLLGLIASGALGADWKGLHTVLGPVRLIVLAPDREILVIMPERRLRSVD